MGAFPFGFATNFSWLSAMLDASSSGGVVLVVMSPVKTGFSVFFRRNRFFEPWTTQTSENLKTGKTAPLYLSQGHRSPCWCPAVIGLDYTWADLACVGSIGPHGVAGWLVKLNLGKTRHRIERVWTTNQKTNNTPPHTHTHTHTPRKKNNQKSKNKNPNPRQNKNKKKKKTSLTWVLTGLHFSRLIHFVHSGVSFKSSYLILSYLIYPVVWLTVGAPL